jgi:DNA-binding beta-propeller fold protein YncE
MMVRRAIALAWSCTVLLVVATSANAQVVDTTIAAGTVIEEFADPAALAVDPSGAVYVVDASAATLVRFSPDSNERSVFGGPGSGEYEFDAPSDIDVSAGLIWLVADAGNGRVKRFSSEFLHLGSLPVDLSSFAVTQSAGTGGFREEEGDPLRYSGGRPVAVASSMSDETFAVDANANVVIKWDATRRIERVFGRPSEMRGALVEPVDIAVDRRGKVFVADRAQDAVLVYDRFGTFTRRIADGLAGGIVAVTAADDRLLIVSENRVLVYTVEGKLLGRYTLDLGEPLRDVSVADGAFVVLTERRLVRVPF